MLRLVIEDDEGKTTVVPLIRDEITIGRKEGNTIRLTERNVSRRHARLRRVGDGSAPSVLVEDLDSYNGIRLNGDRVAHQCTMRPGDLIQIGDYCLALQTDRPTGEVPSTSDDGQQAVALGRAAASAIEDVATTVHRLEDEDLLPEDRQGRLVVVSSNLAGQTYALARREIIMGRTGENDVVIAHRSISRNHAKIVVRDGAFTIIDLASSNGVKINGDPFGTVALVDGDVIELGHVKLRFVAPGHEYVFTPTDIDDVEIRGGVGTGRLILIALLLAAIAVVAFLFVSRRTGEETSRAGPPPTQTAKAPAPAPVPAPPKVDHLDVNGLLNEGRAHLQAESWDAAASVFERVLQAQADHAEARELKNKATSEAANQRRFARLNEQVENEQWADAYFAMAEFPGKSVYTPRVEAMRKRIETGYADSELERGRSLLGHDSISGAKKVQVALTQKPFAAAQAATLAREIRDAKRAAEVVARAPERAPPKKPTPRAHPKHRAPREEAEPRPSAQERDVQYDDLMRRSLKLIALGKRNEAAGLLEQAHRLRPGDKTPHQRLCAIYRPLGKLKLALKHCKRWLAKETHGSYKPAIERTIRQLETEMNR